MEEKLVYCCNCELRDDCEQSEYCGCCYDGREYAEDEENGNKII